MIQFIITYVTAENNVMSVVVDAEDFSSAIHATTWQVPEQQMISIIRSPHRFGSNLLAAEGEEQLPESNPAN